jgi:hypothetical protein
MRCVYVVEERCIRWRAGEECGIKYMRKVSPG